MANGTLNELTLIGFLGRAPELKSLNGGGEVFSASLATDEGYKDRHTGAAVERTEWTKIEAFGKLATIMGEHLKKGSKVFVRGAKLTDEYEKDGVKRYAVKLVVEKMLFLDGKKSGQEYTADAQPTPVQQPAQVGYQLQNGLAIMPSDVQRYKAAGIAPWPVGQKEPLIPEGF